MTSDRRRTRASATTATTPQGKDETQAQGVAAAFVVVTCHRIDQRGRGCTAAGHSAAIVIARNRGCEHAELVRDHPSSSSSSRRSSNPRVTRERAPRAEDRRVRYAVVDDAEADEDAESLRQATIAPTKVVGLVTVVVGRIRARIAHWTICGPSALPDHEEVTMPTSGPMSTDPAGNGDTDAEAAPQQHEEWGEGARDRRSGDGDGDDAVRESASKIAVPAVQGAGDISPRRRSTYT
jgi:hypothetical protein